MTWRTEGFEGFSRGWFGNGGQNLYVSRAGVLQRIFQYDLAHHGYFDLVFPQTQDHHEAMPTHVFREDGTFTVLPAQGASDATVADLTGDGFLDLVIANHYDAAMPYCSADIYFGSAEGYGEKYHTRVPAPFASGVAAGRFNGGKRPALAFALPLWHKLRIFNPCELGCFEWMRYTDLTIDAEHLCACDLDGDGYDDLIVRKNDGSEMRVYWGGPDGLNPGRHAILPPLPPEECDFSRRPLSEEAPMPDRTADRRLVQTVVVNGRRCFTRCTGKAVEFIASDKGRGLERVLSLPVPYAVSVVQGDLDGDGFDELVVAARDAAHEGSLIFWGGQGGYTADNCTRVPTVNACDAAIMPGGRIVFAQSTAGFSFTAPAPIFQVSPDHAVTQTGSLTGHFPRRVFAVQHPGGPLETVFVNTHDKSAVGAKTSPIYWGGPDGYSAERCTHVPCHNGVDSISADLNDDGWAELAICNNSEEATHRDKGIDIHYFGAESGFKPRKSLNLPVGLGWAATVADFDHDGFLEIASVSHHYREITLYRCLPDDTFEELYSVPVGRGTNARWLTAVDLNRNGWLDLVVPCNRTDRTVILWGGPEGFSMERHTELAVYQGVCVRAADLTGNGYPDLVVGSHFDLPVAGELVPHQPQASFLHIYWNGPEGISESRKTLLRSDSSDSIAIGDFNGDGWLDVFTGSYHSGKDRDCMSYLYWNRNGHFHEEDRQLLYTHSASGCMAADLDNDGRVDLVVANHKVWGDHAAQSAVWWNGPDGFSERSVTLLPTCGPHGLTAVEPGNQLDRGPEEYYISESARVDGKAVVGWSYEGECPPDTWLKIRFATAESAEALETAPWSEWREAGEFAKPLPTKAFARYQLAVGARLGLRTPRITAIEIQLKA